MPPAPVHRVASHSRALVIAAMTLLALLVMPQAAHAAAGQSLGIQAHVLWSGVDGAELNRQLDLAKQARAQVVRVDVGWASLEPDGKGQWSTPYRDRLDNLVAQAQRRGLRLLLTLADTPCWASSAPASLKQGCAGSWWDRGVQYYTPSKPQDYADALSYLIRRYGSRVSAWEVWNEPNSVDSYRAADPARDYVALVKSAYRSAKAADRKAMIVAGAVMQSDFEFTRKLYRAGIKGYFDAFSIHPYCEDRSPLDPWQDEWTRLSFVRGVPKVREVMLSYGDSRPMWLTEFGWSTSTTRDGGAQNNGVDDATQGRNVTEAIRQVSQWSYVQTAIYYNLVDTLDDAASRYGNYGLMRRNGSGKSAFNAFRDAAGSFGAVPRTALTVPRAAGGLEPARADGGSDAARAVTTPRRSLRSVAVKRIRGGLRITGASVPRARVRLAIFRVRRGRAAQRPTLNRGTQTNARGRFALVVRDKRLIRGSWRAVHRRLR